MRTYTVHNLGQDFTYNGFCSYRNDKDPFVLGIVHFDGEPELWALDDYTVESENQLDEGIKELRRYYKEQYDREIDIETFSFDYKWDYVPVEGPSCSA